MLRSESIKLVATKLAKARLKFRPVIKDANNPAFRSKYADLAGYLDAIEDGLASQGLILVQATDLHETAGFILQTSIVDGESGEWIGSVYPIRPVKDDPQGAGSALTYARRYSIGALLCLAAEDDDGNAASHRPAPPPQRRPEPTPEMRRVEVAHEPAPAPANGFGEWVRETAQANRIPTPQLTNHLAKAFGLTGDAAAKGQALREMWADTNQRLRLKGEAAQYATRLVNEQHTKPAPLVATDADSDPDMP